MSSLRRVTPRRPFTRTADGTRRIVLGEVAGEGDAVGMAPAATARQTAKPLRTDKTPRRSLLVVAHSDRGVLDTHARQAIAAAALLADADTAVHLLVFGELHDDAAALGADRVTVLPISGVFAPDVALAALQAIVTRKQPDHIFLPDNGLPDGDLGRRFAAATGGSVAVHVVELTPDGVATYQQQRTRLARRAWPRIVLLAPDAVDPRLPFVGKGERIDVSIDGPFVSVYQDLGTIALDASQVALEEADFIVAAGNGVRDLEGFHALADAFGAAVGASRVAVDDGRFTRDQQIGATGKTVGASAYMAFGISGAVQHLQGIKDCSHVIAVNLDAGAPMVQRADLSIIDDAQHVARALLDEVRRARAASQGAAHG